MFRCVKKYQATQNPAIQRRFIKTCHIKREDNRTKNTETVLFSRNNQTAGIIQNCGMDDRYLEKDIMDGWFEKKSHEDYII